MDKISFQIKSNEFLTDFSEKSNVIIDNKNAISAYHNFPNEFISIISNEITPIDSSKICIDSLGRIEITDDVFKNKIKGILDTPGGSCTGTLCNCNHC